MKAPEAQRRLRWNTSWLPLVVAGVLLLAGIWMRSAVVFAYDGPPTQGDFVGYAFGRLAYSDISFLYFRDSLADQPTPYFDYPLEYPIGTGLVIWLLNSVMASLPAYFLANSLFLGACGLLIARLIPEFPRGNPWLFALSPALILYVNLNWDMWGVLLMILALLLFVRERDAFGTVALAAAVWTKFFPVLFLPLVLADRFWRKGWKAGGRIALWFALASAAINLPLLLTRPDAWWYFFEFNAERGGGLNAYTLFFPEGFSEPEVANRIGALLVILGLPVVLFLQRRTGTWLVACPALMAWFFFWSKISSPQYDLWIVSLLAVIGGAPALAVGWWGVDAFFFFANFVHGGLGQHSPEAQGWFTGYILEPAAAIREVALLIVTLWCVNRMWRERNRAYASPPNSAGVTGQRHASE